MGIASRHGHYSAITGMFRMSSGHTKTGIDLFQPETVFLGIHLSKTAAADAVACRVDPCPDTDRDGPRQSSAGGPVQALIACDGKQKGSILQTSSAFAVRLKPVFRVVAGCFVERETGLEPATFCLEGRHSTN